MTSIRCCNERNALCIGKTDEPECSCYMSAADNSGCDFSVKSDQKEWYAWCGVNGWVEIPESPVRLKIPSNNCMSIQVDSSNTCLSGGHGTYDWNGTHFVRLNNRASLRYCDERHAWGFGSDLEEHCNVWITAYDNTGPDEDTIFSEETTYYGWCDYSRFHPQWTILSSSPISCNSYDWTFTMILLISSMMYGFAGVCFYHYLKPWMDLKKELENLKMQRKCIICWENPRDHVIFPCMHFCICKECAEGAIITCPCCRSKVQEICRIYDG